MVVDYGNFLDGSVSFDFSCRNSVGLAITDENTNIVPLKDSERFLLNETLR